MALELTETERQVLNIAQDIARQGLYTASRGTTTDYLTPYSYNAPTVVNVFETLLEGLQRVTER